MLPMQYTEIFSAVKIKHSTCKIFIYFFLIFAQNIDCGYKLEPNEYPQSMFWRKIKKIRYTHAYPSFSVKVAFKGVCIARTCFPGGSYSIADILL